MDHADAKVLWERFLAACPENVVLTIPQWEAMEQAFIETLTSRSELPPVAWAWDRP